MTETAKERIEKELIPDYWIISGQVFKNKEDFVKQQMEFNSGDIRENWESSFDHFAIPVYRDPIFVSEYENGVKASFVRRNKVLQEQLKKFAEENERLRNALEDIRTNTPIQELLNLPYGCACHEIASDALAAIGGDDE